MRLESLLLADPILPKYAQHDSDIRFLLIVIELNIDAYVKMNLGMLSRYLDSAAVRFQLLKKLGIDRRPFFEK